MARLTKVLSFSNIVACLALFIALGGSVYAAGKLSGSQIKANSIPGNRIKGKTLTGKQIRPHSLTGRQIKAGSLTGAQIEPGSLTGSQIDVGTLTGVTASLISSIRYATTSVVLTGNPAGNSGTASCPTGTSVIGGGAIVSNEEAAYVNDGGPNAARNGWTATGVGPAGTSMTVTAICTAAAGVSG